jgi:type VI secretion system secreted protein VgrG
VALGSWNYRNLAGASAELASALDLGEVPWLEQYDGSGAYRFADTQAAERAARLALGALELQAKRFAGQGGARVLRAGAQFQLIDHPLYGANTTAMSYAAALTASHPRPDNAFTVLAVEHHVANNLGDQAAELLKQTALAKGGYRNQFQAVPAAAPVLPAPARAPTAPYLLTARVVGLQDEALTTERDHRVKVQFHFQRGAPPTRVACRMPTVPTRPATPRATSRAAPGCGWPPRRPAPTGAPSGCRASARKWRCSSSKATSTARSSPAACPTATSPRPLRRAWMRA